jgi:hypothetical protein
MYFGVIVGREAAHNNPKSFGPDLIKGIRDEKVINPTR